MNDQLMIFIEKFNPVIQAFFATLFTWGVTAMGASLVLFTENVNRKFLDMMLGFAAGIMLAASFWSLLLPSIELAEKSGLPSWLPATIGFLAGGGFLRLIDQILPHLHLGFPVDKSEGIKSSLQRSMLLVVAVTIHNIPEGLAVGVAFGAAGCGYPSVTVASAAALALGIGMQNFPEGLAVSMPLRREGLSRTKSLWYGQLSGFVETVAGVVGAAAILFFRPLMPYALSFAAGAMIFVIIEEVIPECQVGENGDIATLGAMSGFTIMMILDVAIG